MNSVTKLMSVVALNITVLVGCGANEVNQSGTVKGGGTPAPVAQCYVLLQGFASSGSVPKSGCLSKRDCSLRAYAKNVALKKSGKTGTGYFCEKRG